MAYNHRKEKNVPQWNECGEAEHHAHALTTVHSTCHLHSAGCNDAQMSESVER